MTFGSLFSGIGGMDLGLERAGMTCKWQVEIEPYCQRVLAKHWPEVKRYGDIRSIDGSELESIDLVAGGFPCQDISTAGHGIGIIGARSGLWAEFKRVLAGVRPRFAFIENVPALRGRGLALVLQDLWSLGFDAEWHCIPAASLGAPHLRDRIWIVGYPAGLFGKAIIWGEPDRSIQANDADFDGHGCQSRSRVPIDGASEWQATRWKSEWRNANEDATNPHCSGLEESKYGQAGEQPATLGSSTNPDGEPLVRVAIARGERHAWTSEPGVVRMVHGVPHRVDRLKGLGNAVVPQVVEWIGRRILEAAC